MTTHQTVSANTLTQIYRSRGVLLLQEGALSLENNKANSYSRMWRAKLAPTLDRNTFQ